VLKIPGHVEIICERCGKKATISKEDGVLCIECWRELRKEKRKARIIDSLESCFAYYTGPKVTQREAKLINDVMCELEKAKKKQKVYK
jgi:hypothetical protein